MGSPVKVEAPVLREQTAQIFAYWADKERQEREWIRRDTPDVFFDTLYYQLGEVYDTIDVLPIVESPLGVVVANRREVAAFERLGVAMEAVLASKALDWDHAESFVRELSWSRVVEESARCLRILVLDGGCWGDPSPATLERHLVANFRARSSVTRSLASIARPIDTVDDDPLPLETPRDVAAGTLLSLASDPDDTDTFVRKGDEPARMTRVLRALAGEKDDQVCGRLAGDALNAIVLNGKGWTYDGDLADDRSVCALPEPPDAVF